MIRDLMLLSLMLLIMLVAVPGIAADSGWPREINNSGNRLVIYQPQVDDWRNFRDIDLRMAVALTPANAQTVLGVVELQALTVVDHDSKVVLLSDFRIKRSNFPSLDKEMSGKMESLVASSLPNAITASLDRIVASTPKKEGARPVELKHDPPSIFVSYKPSILLDIDGKPVRAAIGGTGLEYVVNTHWPLFFETSSSTYFLLVSDRWMQATDPAGPWIQTPKLPDGMKKLAKDPNWKYLKKYVPPPSKPVSSPAQVFYSTSPAEIIYIDGKPSYSDIQGTQLQYVSNTVSYIFLYRPTGQYYYLTSGRWFTAPNLGGPWKFASWDLPDDFRKIPATSPAAQVLASVPGTEQARDAVMLAQIPVTATVTPDSAAKTVKVVYVGAPQFAVIEGTTLYYATNTAQKVIKVGDLYYLCFQGVWFLSAKPEGPWQTAKSVPRVIYTIPPSSPVYNVTYVTQTVTPLGTVQASYTSGYMGSYIVGVSTGLIIASGTGYYYPPYISPFPPFGYPVYYPPPLTYGYAAHYYTAAGAYGVAQVAYGPYGAAAATSSYNPYTGNYTRTATVANAYGATTTKTSYNAYTGTSRASTTTTNIYGTAKSGQAYNPYTGGYAATTQGANAYGSWGSSVVSRGGKTVTTQHQTNSMGTKESMQTSSGRSVNTARTASGNTSLSKTGAGDIYAGHDGNLYKKTDSGWEKYNGNSWSSVQPRTAESMRPQSQGAQSHQVSQEQMQSLQRESWSRERGEFSSQRNQEMQHTWGDEGRSFGGGGRGFGGRSFGGGMRRR